MRFDVKPTRNIPNESQCIDVVRDGKKLGEIKPNVYSSGELYYHASFNARSSGSFNGNPLLQGFGETRIEAIKNAVESGRKEAVERLAAVEDAEKYLADLLSAVEAFEGGAK